MTEPSIDYYHRLRIVGASSLSRRRRGMVRLWTFQPLSVWHQLQDCRSLYVDPTYIDDDASGECYAWMRQQMALRLPNYEGHSPWWSYEGQRPDLRSFEWHFPGGHGVCLELQMSRERVLLHDYESWHAVMSRQYLALTESEQKEWYREEDALGYKGGWPAPRELKERVVQSWERIFDLEVLVASGYWKVDHVNGCFERLNLADVVSVTELVARK